MKRKQEKKLPSPLPPGVGIPLANSAPDCGDSTEQPANSHPFLIAALGASAGGLEALEKFFHNMPADADIAFVVVMHLSPDHTSSLPELLARCTRMAVKQVLDKTKIVPNCVYIIPPNATLTINDGTLHVTALHEARGRRTAIDHLFRSLAEDRGENAVCIILSGTGTDGTQGLRAVKEHGGMAMAQTLESAKYDAILRSAIATGLVDHVLPVQEMPAKLKEYVTHLYSVNGQANNIRQQIEKHGNKIHSILRRSVGHDFSEYKDGTIVRRLDRRMKALQVETVEQYVEVLEQQPSEANLLFKDLLIGITDFFRDAEAFEALERDVIPKIFQRNREAGTQLRVCVVGCATGEEAYSIAILLREHASTLNAPPEIKIFATDIDERALEAARKGCYPEAIAEHVSAERLDRFFIKQDNSYQVKRELREVCLFSNHNFIKDPPFSRLDLISCRNVLIYLGENLQRKVVPLLHYALRSGGYLFLGPAESVMSFRELFSVIDKKRRVFQRRDTRRTPVAFPLTDVVRTRRFHGIPQEEAQNLPRRLERIILRTYAPACAIVSENGDAVYFSGKIGHYLEQPTGSPDTNILNMAREGLRIPLRTALHRAVTANERVIQKYISLQMGGETIYIDLSVEGLAELQDANLYMVMITETAIDKGRPPSDVQAGDNSSQQIIRRLEGELRSAQDRAQSIFEELESVNEELRSANEEYQSTNEELETSKEELQSFNEELETVNAELNRKVAELDTTNSDLQNFLSSTEIATIFLDAEFNIRNFTPAAANMFHLISGDVGRPITDLAVQFTDLDLLRDAREVFETLVPSEQQIEGLGGRYYQRRILPYRTVHHAISGVVLIYVDVTQLRQSEQRAQQERAYAESIVDSVREPLVVLDDNLRVISASKAFYDMFYVSFGETVKKSLFDFGNQEWDIPEFRNLLTKVLRENRKVDDYEVENEFPQLGRRTMRLNARRLERGETKQPLLLLAMEDITERKRVADALRASERRHREIIEALPAGVYTTDAEGHITMFNQATVEFSGLLPELGLDSWPVTLKMYGPHGALLPVGEDPMLATLKNNKTVRGAEGIVERPDGTFRNFLAYPTPLYDESGKITGGVNILVDITERKKIEEKLRESEEQLRSLFEQASGGIAQTDLTGRFLMVNDGFCRIVGRSREELANLHMQDITHPEDLPGNLTKFATLAEGRGSNFEIENRYLRPDGSHVWVQNQVSAIHDAQGDTRYIVATVTDISDRKRAEEARGLLVALVESSDDAIISEDIHRCIRSWNAGAERLFGYLAQEVIGEPITILFPAGLPQEFSIVEGPSGADRVQPYETNCRRKDGTTVDVLLTISPIIDQDGRVVGASTIARDITDRKRIEQERRDLEERERALTVATALRQMEAELAHVTRALTVGELATSIAHEVNQPLAGIVTNAEAGLRWLRNKEPNLHEAQQSLALIVRDGNRASEVIRRIREFLRKDDPQIAALDINNVVLEAIALAHDELLKRNVELRVELANDLPLVRGDRIQLQQVILNLIMNGSEAMGSVTGRPRELLITSRKASPVSIVLAVSDSGSGINPRDIDRIFDAFFTTKPAGMGMGLSISRSIIEAHGGRIWATLNDGSGLTVQFTLADEQERPS